MLMQKFDTKVGKFTRGVLAVFLALLVVGVALPNAGHFVVHPEVSPKTVFESSFHDRLMVCAWPVVPLICIFTGMFFRHGLLEYIGWALLIILVAASL
jgi:hypothetical protein